MSKATKDKDKYDAIVIGSGITGGLAAKILCEGGLKTLVIERGRDVKHGDYPTAHDDPWDLPNHDQLTPDELRKNPLRSRAGNIKPSNQHWYMQDAEQEYVEEKPFMWVRGNQVGGRSLIWGRQVYRWSPDDFTANLRDGIGVDWPIRYDDVAPWYDYVEQYIGVSGKAEGIPQIPDGKFLPPMQMNCLEGHIAEKIKSHYQDRIMTIGRVANLTQTHNGREACKYRDRCDRGCPYGAYFSSLSTTLLDAADTHNLTLAADQIVTEIIYNPENQKAKGVRVLDKQTGEYHLYNAKLIFLNASTINSTWLLLNSKSARFPDGMGNDSGELGHNLMDHYIGGGASGDTDLFKDKYYAGRRPNGIYIPRFQNLKNDQSQKNYIRGFQYQGRASRSQWDRHIPEAAYGLNLKEQLLRPGKWQFGIMGLGETLPYHDNKMHLHPTKKDKYGLPQIVLDVHWRDNEMEMAKDMIAQAVEMLKVAGLQNVKPVTSNAIPASAVHEMGTARMGRDASTSVLNEWNQIHGVKNVFVTDGSCMTSSACQNPSLTYMALTARAAHYSIEQLKKGEL